MTPGEKRRNAHLIRNYGITLADYQKMLDYQGGVCYVCEKEPKAGKNHTVDHDHTTRLIRGVLCAWCNLRLIGKWRNGELLMRGAEYLIDPPAQHVLPGHKAPPKKRQPRKRPRK
jgi:hypothetical protein